MWDSDQLSFPQTYHSGSWISLSKRLTLKPLFRMPCTSNIYIYTYIFFHSKNTSIKVSRIHFRFGVNIHWSVLAGTEHFDNTNAFLHSLQHHSELFIIKKGENNFSFPLNIQWANTNLKENWNSLCGTLNNWQFRLY